MSRFKPLKRALHILVDPNSSTEDARRQEFVLNVLLLGALALAFSALVQVCLGALINGPAFRGAPPMVVLGIVGFFGALYVLSRRGHPRWAAYVFIGAFTLIAGATSYRWGIGLPAAALVFVLVIVMAGVLGGTWFSLVMTGLLSMLMLALGYMESTGISHPDFSWMNQNAGLNDAFGYIFIWGVIALVSWLSNHEIERSLLRARNSEAALARERDLLEDRVEERTRELKQAQLEKILQLNRFADFGRISSGFFHDIINPLTAVSLNLEQLSTKERSDLLKQAIAGIKHIEGFALAARKQVQGHNTEVRLFSPADETREVLAILENKARGTRVSLVSVLDGSLKLHGSPVKFHQLVSNLVANAIDAYDNAPAKSRVVTVELRAKQSVMLLSVSDSGVGIHPDHIRLVFDPFFTTKPVDKGTGIGLLIVKRIVEEDFNGSISIASKPGMGTTFTVTMPAAPE